MTSFFSQKPLFSCPLPCFFSIDIIQFWRHVSPLRGVLPSSVCYYRLKKTILDPPPVHLLGFFNPLDAFGRPFFEHQLAIARWRRASYIKMAAATETLSDCTCPRMGNWALKSAILRSSGLMPVSSAPMMRRVGLR